MFEIIGPKFDEDSPLGRKIRKEIANIQKTHADSEIRAIEFDVLHKNNCAIFHDQPCDCDFSVSSHIVAVLK